MSTTDHVTRILDAHANDGLPDYIKNALQSFAVQEGVTGAHGGGIALYHGLSERQCVHVKVC